MYDIIARRRLSTVLRYIFDFLPKEETSIHLNTKKAVLSNRRNSDTEPYIMLNIFLRGGNFQSPLGRSKQVTALCPARSSSSRFPANFVSPSALFSHLSVSAFLLHHRMRFKTLQYCPSSVAAADKSRRRTLSGFCLPGPRQTSFPLPLFSLTFRFPLFYCTTVCVSKLFNTAPAPLRRQTNQDAVHCPAFVFPVPGKLRFPFRSFLSPFGFRIYRATVCVSKLFNADTAPLRRQTIKAPYPARSSSSRFPARNARF